MSDLLTEVDEMMRQERMAKIWADYGSWIVGFIVFVIVMTAGVSVFKSWNQGVQETQTAQLLSLSEADNYPQNIVKADLSAMRGGVRSLVLLNAAGAFVAQGDDAEALVLYGRIAEDAAAPFDLADLANLMVVRLSDDTVNAEDLIARLSGIYGRSGATWAMHARLEAALVEANMKQDYAAALIHLNEIESSVGVPDSLREKARALTHVYGLKAGEVKSDG